MRIGRAERHKARRQARQSLHAAAEKRVQFEDAGTTMGIENKMTGASWTDEFHEPDGTHPTLIVGDFHLGHAERVRTALRESANAELDKTTTRARSTRELAHNMYLTSGINEGAELLKQHLSALVTRGDTVSCIDDVSGEALDEAGVKAARALEM